MLWTNGVDFVGSRLDRTLWMLERNDVLHCPMCGKSHVHHAPKTQYRSVEVASEPISSEAWREVPNGSVFSINGDLGLELLPLTSDSHQM